jgi:hypothetical protein
MFKFEVNEEKCVGCKKCSRVCPKAFKIWAFENKSSGLKAVVKAPNFCLFCGMCVTVCPTKAITIETK